jgi:hypothetical protein
MKQVIAMNQLVHTIGRDVGQVLLWTLLCGATLTGTLMIAIGMFEELPGIIRDVWNRSFHP